MWMCMYIHTQLQKALSAMMKMEQVKGIGKNEGEQQFWRLETVEPMTWGKKKVKRS